MNPETARRAEAAQKKEHAKLVELGKELPGWFVYTSSIRPWWRAVPAPPDVKSSYEAIVVRRLKGEVGANTPDELLALAKERYGWDDYCETCPDTFARDCGHRQPEREKSGA